MIFGIGLLKTGLTSLTRAMSILGYRVEQYLYPDDLENITRFDFVCDQPIPWSYREWDKKLPGSKFILTTRSRDQWIKSIESHYSRHPPKGLDPLRLRYRQEAFGSIEFDPHLFLVEYDRHHAGVMEYFLPARRSDLLILKLEGGFGWEKLCAFLNIEKIPAEAFPHLNKGNADKEEDVLKGL